MERFFLFQLEFLKHLASTFVILLKEKSEKRSYLSQTIV